MARMFINSRGDFHSVLDQTLAEARGLAAETPGYAPMKIIVRQLEAMKAWTAGGRTPTPEERQRVDIGVIAVRELEPTETPEQDDFNLRLHELNGYFEDWPED
jgi:hypothetical protein